MVDQLKDKLKSAVVLLAVVADNKISLVGGVTPDLTGKLKAGDLVGAVAAKLGGTGGDLRVMARVRRTGMAALEGALAGVAGWAQEKLA